MKGAGTYPYKRRVSDKKMKNSELKEYLNSFPDDTEVSVIIANTKAKKKYPLTDYHGITNMEQPVFLLEIGKPENLDDEKDTDIPGQTNFETDFPEVMPQ